MMMSPTKAGQSHAPATEVKRDRHGNSPVPSRTSSRSRSRSRSSSNRRPSFESIKEGDTGIQSFVHSKGGDLAADIAAKPGKTAFQLPASQVPDFFCPCGTFRGWKRISLAGRTQSKSFSDLRLLGGLSRTPGWTWEDHDPDHAEHHVQAEMVTMAEKPRRKTRASLEMMPPEILDQIISLLFIEVPPNGYTPRNVDLMSCLLTCRTLHSATLGVLYRNITIPHSIIFSKALNHIRQYPSLGTIVRRLDFSHFTSVGLGRTQRMNVDIQNLTARTLLECLELLPNLKELLLQEHLEDDIDANVLRKIFERSPALKALDFCSASSPSFTAAVNAALVNNQDLPQTLPSLKRISFHECTSLPDAAFQNLLPRLVNLTHLDVAHTPITAKSLFSISPSARITHLNISRCTKLTGPEVVQFLTTHPAVKDTLVYLNLMVDVSRHLLLAEADVDALLPRLSDSLRSLNLGGTRISSRNMPQLLELSKHVEELGLNSADITIEDINSFFSAPPKSPNGDTSSNSNWTRSELRYIDLTKNPYITQSALLNPKACLLATPHSRPLDVIELSEKTIAPLRKRKGGNWVVRDLGRRAWYVREGPADVGPADDGRRDWKMGARWWGMRKIPVTVGEVGGINGHYMFKK